MNPEINTLIYGHVQIVERIYGVFQVLEHYSKDIIIVTPITHYSRLFMPIRFLEIDFHTSDLDIAKTQYPEYFI